MNEVVVYLLGLLPTLITGVVLYMVQRKIRIRDEAAEERAATRKRESLLQLKMLMASNKLSFAVAMAVKRGKPNGEVEDAIDIYNEAKDEYYAFLNEQAAEHLTGGK